MTKLRSLVFLGLALGLGCLLTVVCRPSLAMAPAAHPAQEQLTNAELSQVAAEALSNGDFMRARETLNLLGSEECQSEVARSVAGLLDGYDELMAAARDSRVKAYQEHQEKMAEAVGRARWREAMLATSESIELDSDAKDEEEEELRTSIEDDWLAALGQLTAAHRLAERVEMEETTDPCMHELIVDQALQIAERLEQEQQWIESYGRVYYYLTALDLHSDQYDEHVERLLRFATVDSMYVPDPNQDAVTWQERRKGVDFEMIHRAFNMVELGYVDEPDFKEMASRGLRNCLTLAETDKLAEAFSELADADLAEQYRAGARRLIAEVVGEDDNGESEENGQVNSDSDPSFGMLGLLRAFQRIIQLNDETVQLPEEVIMAEFAEGAFAALDAYTYLVWPSDVAEFNKDMTNEFFGVGIVISKVNGQLSVDSLLDDSPAMRAGLDAGDRIIAVDKQSTARITLDMAVRRITGPENTEVVLTIDRDGFEKPRDFTVTRGKIVVQTIKGLLRDDQGQWQYYADEAEKLAYVRITSFSGETPARLRWVLDQLREQGMRGLVLDLRSNSGGYLSGAVEIVDDFVSTEAPPIVSTRSPRFPEQGHADPATRAGTFDDELPMVVLVDSASASASEIVSGSLRDHGRALIVGTRTFGKGNVQQIYRLRPSDAQLKMTMAYYYLPSGRRVHRDPKDKTNDDYGVEPHVKLELTAEQMKDYAKVRREAGILHLSNGENGDWTVYTADEVVASDPQLAIGLSCLRGGLLAKDAAD